MISYICGERERDIDGCKCVSCLLLIWKHRRKNLCWRVFQGPLCSRHPRRISGDYESCIEISPWGESSRAKRQDLAVVIPGLQGSFPKKLSHWG